MQDLLHVVVGAGFPHYFSNCLKSLSGLTPHHVLAFYNYVDETDRVTASEVARKCGDPRITFEFRENVSDLRTGSLYTAYNDALKHAEGKYRFISFIQADMQLMWWDERIISACDRILNEANQKGISRVSFFSQIPVKGKRRDYYSIWDSVGAEETPMSPGIVDVGIFPLEKFNSSNFKFEGSERELSQRAGSQGAVVALHPYPFIAPIPFPSTLRDPRKKTGRVVGPGQNQPILRIASDLESFPDFGRKSFHPLFMEDTVWPNGWYALTPFWPSDSRGTQWLRIRIAQAKSEEISPLRLQGNSRKTKWGIFRKFRPGLRALMKAVWALTVDESVRRLRLVGPKRVT
jgi:hypothetical protein